jgi:hypothetical protein
VLERAAEVAGRIDKSDVIVVVGQSARELPGDIAGFVAGKPAGEGMVNRFYRFN